MKKIYTPLSYMYEDMKKRTVFISFLFLIAISILVLQYLLQNIKSVAILIEKSQSIAILCNTI